MIESEMRGGIYTRARDGNSLGDLVAVQWVGDSAKGAGVQIRSFL